MNRERVAVCRVSLLLVLLVAAVFLPLGARPVFTAEPQIAGAEVTSRNMITFSSSSPDDAICTVNVDTHSTDCITQPYLEPNASDTEPIWSPDGTRIAFQRQYWGDVYDCAFFSVRFDGSDLVRLSGDKRCGGGWEARWSPDGQRVSFTAGPIGGVDGGIYIGSVNGADPVLLPSTQYCQGIAAWSPDGASIAAKCYLPGDTSLGIFLVSPDGSNVRRVWDLPADTVVHDIRWSPQGDRLLLNMWHWQAGFQELSVLTLDTAEITLLTSTPSLNPMEAAWSPTGNRVAFHQNSDTSEPTDVFTLSADGTGLRNISSDPAYALNPTWSPDNCRIGFFSGRSSPGVGFYVMNADGSNQAFIGADGDNPQWSPAISAADPRCPDVPLPPPAPVVLLVHGWDGNSDSTSCGMEPLEQYIENPSNMGGHSFDAKCLRYHTREGVIAGAQALKQRIDATGRDKVDIVAHSMGGVVARYYIEKLGGRSKVRSLTMLGTPNWGTAIAIAACDWNWWYLFRGQHDKYDQAACDLVPFSPIILNLNLNPGSHAGVSYNVITGYVGWNPLLQLPNDCVVPAASAVGLGFPMTLRPVSHITMSGAAALVAGCVAPGEIDDAGVHEQVRDILLASNGLAAPAVQMGAQLEATPTPPPDEPAPDILLWQNGVIANGQTVEVPVAMPEGQTWATFQFRASPSPDVTLAYSLLRPEGAAVSEGDPDVSLVVGPAFDGADETRYEITAPTSGVWTMQVIGATVPVSGWPYEVRSSVPARISVAASVGAGHYDTGEAIAVEADVAIAGTPVADATVNATVRKPDGTSAAVPLGGDGTGTYSGSFGDTSACGIYRVVVTASGTDDSTPFTREGGTIAVVGVPGNAILDPCNADSDGDGLTDEAEISDYLTNPAAADTDGDSVLDGVDNCPFAPNADQADADVDGIGNACTVGDGNRDGLVSMVDAMLTAQYVAGLIGDDGLNLYTADVNRSGSVSMVDAMMIAQKVAGLISEFPVCSP